MSVHLHTTQKFDTPSCLHYAVSAVVPYDDISRTFYTFQRGHMTPSPLNSVIH